MLTLNKYIIKPYLNTTMVDDFESTREAQEDLILLLLGVDPKNHMSKLHIEKDIFLLYKIHPKIQQFIEFSAYRRGPYSQDIAEAIQSPYYRTEEWDYSPLNKHDKYSSGYIKLTEKGLKEYKKLYDDMLRKEKCTHYLLELKL